ncbi:hypothetical protein X975_05932, partial [Stegodyphus mimosarum]
MYPLCYSAESAEFFTFLYEVKRKYCIREKFRVSYFNKNIYFYRYLMQFNDVFERHPCVRALFSQKNYKTDLKCILKRFFRGVCACVRTYVCMYVSRITQKQEASER